jgi:predicted nucleotidyltransferase
MSSLNSMEKKAIEQLYLKVKDRLSITKVILFGSKARSQSEEYSDVDLILLTQKPKTKQDRKYLSQESAEVNILHGVTLSCMYYNEQDSVKGENINPLFKQNVDREGIEIDLQ